MSMRRVIAGEGDSMPWFRGESGPAPGLVVCPMLTPSAGTNATMLQEVYRMAYERAQAALRPTAYELAGRACWN